MGKFNFRKCVYDFEAVVAGIPCTIAVISFHSGWEEEREGWMAGPAEPPSADWVLVDRNGYEARWLHNKLTPDDEYYIEELIAERMS